MTPQAQSLIGLVAIPLIAWALSERRAAIGAARLARLLAAGLGLQAAIAGVMLNVGAVRGAFDGAAGLVTALQSATGAGVQLVFGYLAGAPAPFQTVTRSPTATGSPSTMRRAPAWTRSPRAPGRVWCCSPT